VDGELPASGAATFEVFARLRPLLHGHGRARQGTVSARAAPLSRPGAALFD